MLRARAAAHFRSARFGSGSLGATLAGARTVRVLRMLFTDVGYRIVLHLATLRRHDQRCLGMVVASLALGCACSWLTVLWLFPSGIGEFGVTMAPSVAASVDLRRSTDHCAEQGSIAPISMAWPVPQCLPRMAFADNIRPRDKKGGGKNKIRSKRVGPGARSPRVTRIIGGVRHINA